MVTNDERKGIGELGKCQGQGSSLGTFCKASTTVWGSIQRQVRASVCSATSHGACLRLSSGSV